MLGVVAPFIYANDLTVRFCSRTYNNLFFNNITEYTLKRVLDGLTYPCLNLTIFTEIAEYSKRSKLYSLGVRDWNGYSPNTLG
jgi:hypothetical protein